MVGLFLAGLSIAKRPVGVPVPTFDERPKANLLFSLVVANTPIRAVFCEHVSGWVLLSCLSMVGLFLAGLSIAKRPVGVPVPTFDEQPTENKQRTANRGA
jgi:hypothetical protein